MNGSHDSSRTASAGGIDSNDIVDFAAETDSVCLRCGAGSFICYARVNSSTGGIEHVGLLLDEYVNPSSLLRKRNLRDDYDSCTHGTFGIGVRNSLAEWTRTIGSGATWTGSFPGPDPVVAGENEGLSLCSGYEGGSHIGCSIDSKT